MSYAHTGASALFDRHCAETQSETQSETQCKTRSSMSNGHKAMSAYGDPQTEPRGVAFHKPP